MKNNIFTTIKTCLLILTLGFWQTGFSQVSINAHNTDFNTNLNGWNGTLPTGFTRLTSLTYQGNSSSSITGGVYAVSNSGFGYKPSGSATSCWIEGTFQNTTGSTITEVVISYQAFSIASDSRIPTWTATSSLGNVSALNWTYTATNTPASPANKTVTLTGLNVANNATFTLRFTSDRGTGSGASPMIGLNNIKVKSVLAVCDIPTNLAENNVTATTSDFNWDADGSNNFQYVLSQTATSPTGAGTAINGISFSTSSLTPSTTYFFHLRQNCGSGNFSNWTYVNFTTPACLSPTGLTASNTTTNSSDLSWNAQGSNGFEYVVDQTATNPTGSGTATTGTTYNATSLNPLTTYYLHVRTNCGGGNFSAWETISFTTLIEPCIAPTGLTAANTTHNSSDLSWNAQGSSTFEYVVDQINTDPATAGTSTTGTTYNATALTPLTTYYLHVRTNCVQGNTSDWETISFTTLIEPCIAPTGLTAANTAHNSSDLSWDAQGSSTFEYVVDQINTDPATAGTSTTGTTYNATALTPLTTYYLHVRTNCVQGNTSGWETISFTTLIEPCIAPTGLTAANTTHNSSDLSWDAQGSSTFEYVVDQTLTDPATAGTSTTGTTYDATALTPLTTYYLHVRTNCVQGNTSDWETISFTTLIEPCIAPTGLTAANTTHNSSDLSWNAQGSSTFEYVVDQINTDPATAGTSTNGTTYNATSLTPLTTYYLHVRTNCVQGNTSDWETISFITLVTPCISPTGLTAANTTHNSSDLSWDTQGSNTFEYVVDQINADPIILGTPTTGTSHHATSLNPLTTYYLHIRTDCSGTNFSPWETISFTTLIEPCTAPTGLVDANTTHNSSVLSWNPQGTNDFEYVFNQTATAPTGSGTVTSDTSYEATSLNPSTMYYLHVRANCIQGNTSDWTTYSFTTLVEPCIAPTGLTASNTTHNSSVLSWNPQGMNDFEFVVDENATSPMGSGTTTSDTSYNAAGLTSETTYYIHVRTDCGNGNFSPWETFSFTTLVGPCAAPTGLTASTITGHAADLSWNTQTGNTFEYVLNQTATAPTASGTATANAVFTASGLTGSTIHYFHVRTDCGNGNFSPWTTLSFTTLSTVGLEEQETISLNVYPNPANGLVTISGQTTGIVTLTNLKGQQLMTLDLEQTNSFDISNLESGMYFVIYETGTQNALIKVIKE
ncbi:fibronectin type III domain-containing protein [Fluviicola taffensis]|uniref:Fibronectin type III domain protein n=1 Tax=Fluviicola taffensis (strain DSM 16823 / NCIMB 13979 / RW262) TaxID=755732 RepID=F2ID20_FLUTR|nr:T9SS type A sorting domain-containing protein [Fluviicola taffensis]AEA44414.1 Fibronectin type III domain protein [Fluviicola taffensis DSM 16823]